MTRQNLSKEERIFSKKHIESLFAENDSFVVYPIRIVYRVEKVEEGDESGVSILVSVSKKRFKRAVKRNRIKRLIKEAYRLNKPILLDNMNDNLKIYIAFLYLKNELVSFKEIENLIKDSLTKISKKLGHEGG